MQTGATLLLDTSSSMCLVDTPGGVLRRIDLLARVLEGVLAKVKASRMVAFNSYPYEIPMGAAIELEEPAGSTALHLALDHLQDSLPEQLLILTDGDSDDPPAALEAMRRLQRSPNAQGRVGFVVQAYYCGPDGHAASMAFLRSLAALGAPGSSSGRFDLAEPQRVAQAVVGLLTHG